MTVRCSRPKIPRATLAARLVAERYPVYAEADITVLSRDVAHETIVDEIVAALRPRVTRRSLHGAENSDR